jgi:hypothetical protein
MIKPGMLVMLISDNHPKVDKKHYGIVISQHRLKLRSRFWKVYMSGHLVMISEDEFIPIYNETL